MSKKERKFNISSLFSPLVIVLVTVAFTSVIIASVGQNPLEAYYYLIKGAFGSPAAIINTINKAVPICFAAFAVSVSTKAGIFNIGVEGQLVFGAFGATLAGVYLQGLPAVVHIPLALLCGMVFGMLYGALPMVLFITRGTNLFVIFILMNNIANLLTTYFVVGPFAGENEMISATNVIQDSAKLPYLITKLSKLHIGIIIVLFVAVLMWLYMNKTTSGYKLRTVGLNRQAATYAGLPVKKYLGVALLVSGALGGLAGGVEVLGNYHRLYDGFSPGYGFDGIPIAMLASGNPFGMILGSLVFGAIRVGSLNMQNKAGVSSELVSVVQGVLITLIACQSFFGLVAKKWARGKKPEKEAAK